VLSLFNYSIGILLQDREVQKGMRSGRVKLGRVFLFVFLIATGAFVGVLSVSAASHQVYPGESIQDAVDAAEPDDTIFVHSGTYYENVNVTKRLILQGADLELGLPVVDAGGNGSAITLSADWSFIQAFTATNSGDYPEAGIKAISNGNTIKYCNASGNHNDGIFLSAASRYNSLINNTANDNAGNGIKLYNSSNNTLRGNNASANDNNGLYLYDSSTNNTVINNTASNNDAHGISLYHSNNNNLTDNSASSNVNQSGIYLAHAHNNTITANKATGNWHGIFFLYSNSNNLTGNSASNNTVAIRIDYSHNNIITNNTASDSTGGSISLGDGFSLSHSSNNTLTGNTVGDNFRGIYFWYTTNNTLTANNVADNHNTGILLEDSSNNNTIQSNNVSSNGYHGVELSSSKNNSLTTNSVSDNHVGICMDTSSSHNAVSANNVSFNTDGISVGGNDNTITGNNASSNDGGIFLGGSHNTVANNNASANKYEGIRLWSANNNTITNNIANDNRYLTSGTGIRIGSSCNNTVSENTAQGNKYGIHLEGQEEILDPLVFIYPSSNNTILRNTVSGNSYGLYLKLHSNNNTVSENNASYNTNDGIFLQESSNNTVARNTVRGNSNNGISIEHHSRTNTISANTATDNDNGIYLNYHSDNTTITDNTVINNDNGILIDTTYSFHPSNGIIVSGNNVSDNLYSGIMGWSSSNNTIAHNTIRNNADGILFSDSNDNTITGNRITGNNHGIFMDTARNGTISGNTISSNIAGIILFDSVNFTVTRNKLSTNDYGLTSGLACTNNVIYNNYFNNTHNAEDDGSTIWNITAIPGTNMVGGPFLGGNYWNDYAGEDVNDDGLGDTLLPYNASGDIANGGDFRPLLLPYTHTDNGVSVDIEPAYPSEIEPELPPDTDLSDAIVITVNVVDDTQANPTDDAYTDITIGVGVLDVETCRVYKAGFGFLAEVDDVATLPTVKPPGEAAFARDIANNSIIVRLYVEDPILGVLPPLEQTIFDTGSGTYPSISGIHNGTITPSCNLTVSKLYTYPCAGTGGHTESIRIWNSTGWNVTATWNGYVEDWHNISFDEPFTLKADEEYNYAIITCSYPQIHHTDALLTANGWINCTSFVDADGKEHYNWIPAIKWK
jgi:parallel beta-helix repeat protein